jgi:hypothetical protein
MLLPCPRAVAAKSVNYRFSYIHAEVVTSLDMPLHVRHELAVHVDKLLAAFAFQMKMTAALLGFVELIRSSRLAVGVPLQDALPRELCQSTINGGFSYGNLSALYQVFRRETAAPVLIEKLDNLVTLTGVVIVSVHSARLQIDFDSHFQFHIIAYSLQNCKSFFEIFIDFFAGMLYNYYGTYFYARILEICTKIYDNVPLS